MKLYLYQNHVRCTIKQETNCGTYKKYKTQQIENVKTLN